MKRVVKILFVLFITVVSLSCRNNSDEIVDITNNTPIIPFNYYQNDTRPLQTSESYTQIEKSLMEIEFNNRMNSVVGKRNKTVAAAIFLVGLKYSIPYAHRYAAETASYYNYVGRYTEKGLFFNKIIDAEGNVHNPWGELVQTHPKFPRHEVQGMGDYYENGLNCSSFVSWALYNGGAVTDAKLLNRYFAVNYPKFPGAYQVSIKEGIEDIRIGDLIGFNNAHIAMVIGVNKDNVVFASADGGSIQGHPSSGLRYHTFNKKTTDWDTFLYKYIVKMENVYGD